MDSLSNSDEQFGFLVDTYYTFRSMKQNFQWVAHDRIGVTEESMVLKDNFEMNFKVGLRRASSETLSVSSFCDVSGSIQS